LALHQLNEHEQAELIKAWWKKYGTWIILLVVIIALCVVGYQYWQRREKLQIQEASVAYQGLLNVATQKKSNTQVLTQAQAIVNTYPRSNYAVLASFFAAQAQVNSNHLLAAEKSLKFAVSKTNSPDLKAIAQLRLARVEIANKQAKQALKTLAQMPKAFQGAAYYVEGEAYQALGQSKIALSYYQKAKTNLTAIHSPMSGLAVLKTTE
jgi:predicted negative regulator of RcsB-dependent stress response